MSEGPDDELKQLALAFDRAGRRYYRPSRMGAISASVARPALAKHLIALAKQGVISLDDLAQGGLQHLVSLTPEAAQWGRLKVPEPSSAGMASSKINRLSDCVLKKLRRQARNIASRRRLLLGQMPTF
jgi:hypothetical protein